MRTDRPLTYDQMVEAIERALMAVKDELREHRHPIEDKLKRWTGVPSENMGSRSYEEAWRDGWAACIKHVSETFSGMHIPARIDGSQ